MDTVIIIILAIVVFGAMMGIVWFEYHGEEELCGEDEYHGED